MKGHDYNEGVTSLMKMRRVMRPMMSPKDEEVAREEDD